MDNLFVVMLQEMDFVSILQISQILRVFSVIMWIIIRALDSRKIVSSVMQHLHDAIPKVVDWSTIHSTRCSTVCNFLFRPS